MTMPARIRVLIADDHLPTREDVRFALEQDERFEVCAEAADAPGAIEAAVRERPNVCLLDVNMPGWGVSAAWEIHARLPQSRVVMLTVSREHRDLFAALRAGAAGYLLKDMDPERLTAALRGVLAGEAAIPRALMAELIGDLQTHGRRRLVIGKRGRAELTAREFEVLELLCDGLHTRKIAERLSISKVTVRRHISEVVRKLGVADRDEAVELVKESL